MLPEFEQFEKKADTLGRAGGPPVRNGIGQEAGRVFRIPENGLNERRVRLDVGIHDEDVPGLEGAVLLQPVQDEIPHDFHLAHGAVAAVHLDGFVLEVDADRGFPVLWQFEQILLHMFEQRGGSVDGPVQLQFLDADIEQEPLEVAAQGPEFAQQAVFSFFLFRATSYKVAVLQAFFSFAGKVGPEMAAGAQEEDSNVDVPAQFRKKVQIGRGEGGDAEEGDALRQAFRGLGTAKQVHEPAEKGGAVLMFVPCHHLPPQSGLPCLGFQMCFLAEPPAREPLLPASGPVWTENLVLVEVKGDFFRQLDQLEGAVIPKVGPREPEPRLVEQAREDVHDAPEHVVFGQGVILRQIRQEITAEFVREADGKGEAGIGPHAELLG